MTLPVLTFGGAGMFRMGVRSIALRTASIDLLLGLSTLGTVALSIANLVRGEPHVYFDAAAMLVTLRLRSEEHTSELQSLMRISYAVFCLKKKKNMTTNTKQINNLYY